MAKKENLERHGYDKDREEFGLKSPFSYINFHPRYIIILIFVLALVTALALNVALSSKNKTTIPSCGDETFYGSCSLIKPFFCDNGILIEKSSLCGCENRSERDANGEGCISKYDINPKNIVLNYSLNGNKSQINFVAYEGMLDYVSKISRTIFYENDQKPLRADFELKAIDEETQREFLLPLVIAIENKTLNQDDQLRIAVSLVQNIPYNFSSQKNQINIFDINYSRYPYEVIYDTAGICGEKSTLLAFLLKEMGYDTVVFYFKDENHEAVGVKCPAEKGYKNTGYCFIETSGPAIISDSSIQYQDGVKIESQPEIIHISYGKSIGKNWPEYKDAEFMKRFRAGDFILFKNSKFDDLKKKYGLTEEYFVE